MLRRARDVWRGVWQLTAPILALLLLVGVGLLAQTGLLGSKLASVTSGIFSAIPTPNLRLVFSHIEIPTDPSTIQFIPTPGGPCEHTVRIVADALGDFRDAQLRAITIISANDIWVVGSSSVPGRNEPFTTHWDGASWRVFPAELTGENESSLQAVAAVASDDVWAVGYRNDSSGTLIEHWDGGKWHIVPSADIDGNSVNRLNGVAAIASNDVWAVGESGDQGDIVQALVEHWDGARWTIVPLPQISAPSSLSGIAATSANDIWVVGFQTTSSIAQPLFLHYSSEGWKSAPSDSLEPARPGPQWDGKGWNPEGVPMQGGRLNAVAALSPDNVWAVGLATGGKYQFALAEHWDGNRWTTAPAGYAVWDYSKGAYTGVAVASQNDAWATFVFDARENSQVAMLKRWDGKEWNLDWTSPRLDKSNNNLLGVAALPANEAWAVGSYSANFPLILRYSEPCGDQTEPPPEPPPDTPTPPPAASPTPGPTDLPAYTQAPAPPPTSAAVPTLTPVIKATAGSTLSASPSPKPAPSATLTATTTPASSPTLTLTPAPKAEPTEKPTEKPTETPEPPSKLTAVVTVSPTLTTTLTPTVLATDTPLPKPKP